MVMAFLCFMKFKFRKILFGGLTLAFLGIVIINPAQAQLSNMWKVVSNLLQPVLSTWDIYAPSNLRFDGEIKPDGSTCADGEILKKTGANNWDCAADATGGAGSSEWTDQSAFLHPNEIGDFIQIGSVTTTSNIYLGVFATTTTGSLFYGSSSSGFTGNFVLFENAAGTDLFTIDASGNATGTIAVFSTSASTTALTFGTASGSSISVTNGTSTRLAVQSLTSGNCVQAAAGGYLVTVADPCGSGGGSQYTTYAWTLSGSTLTATTASTIVDIDGELLFTNATGTIGVFNTSASSTLIYFGTASGSLATIRNATTAVLVSQTSASSTLVHFGTASGSLATIKQSTTSIGVFQTTASSTTLFFGDATGSTINLQGFASTTMLSVSTRIRVATTSPTHVLTIASTTGAALFTINGNNTNGNLLTVASSTGTALFQVATSGQLTIGIYGGRTHLNATGSNPVVNNCGTSPSIVGNDTAGIITAGSGAITNCNLVFNKPYVSSPACVVSEETVALALLVTASSTGMQIVAGSSFESDVFSYICMGVSE